MKLLRCGPTGEEKPAILDSDGNPRSLVGVVEDIAGDTLSRNALSRLANLDPSTLTRVEDGARIGPCVGAVGKCLAIGLNFADHAAEAGMAAPAEPIVFMKATSALCGPNDDVLIPPGSTKTDWEVELGFVIGTETRNVSEETAMDHVAGYFVFNDVSERAYQLEGTGQWVKGKSADTFGPMGPWLVTRDEIVDPQALDLWLDVNGTRRQSGSTRTMIFGVCHLVSYLSRFMSLQPGDVVFTGTPPGVGMGFRPPVYLRDGDEMRLGVAGLGEQRQRVRAAVDVQVSA